LIVRTFHVPCAHAPALSPLPLELDLSPKSAAEELGYTFLPCVLVGLSRAPQFVTRPIVAHQPHDIWADQIDAIVVPESACGGSAVMSLSHFKTRIIAVRENVTKMQVPPEALGIQATIVNSYLDAIGIMVCDRAGIDPAALNSKVASLTLLPSTLENKRFLGNRALR
jgi:hypothetical protein